jgi:hypothetical protein
MRIVLSIHKNWKIRKKSRRKRRQKWKSTKPMKRRLEVKGAHKRFKRMTTIKIVILTTPALYPPLCTIPPVLHSTLLYSTLLYSTLLYSTLLYCTLFSSPHPLCTILYHPTLHYPIPSLVLTCSLSSALCL